MKKLFGFALLAMISFALVGTPAQAATSAKPGTTLVKHKHHKHKKHKKKTT